MSVKLAVEFFLGAIAWIALVAGIILAAVSVLIFMAAFVRAFLDVLLGRKATKK
jgi:hypothetical protein